MSTTVDSRVVEMRFDNKQFESNVQTSMSTLDKLKQKLNLNGAAKGLDGISNAAKKVDFSGMGKGIETVNAKFSAMQVIGMTALSNITNSAINAGKRMVSALTIQPITTGFQEYETQINAIQTILANTQKEGTNVQIVNKALDELNTYADKTIYNFTEMTRNIGTFTAAGVKLQTSVDAIQGIANLAAVSGSTSQQASTAMYQLSQALATGTVKLMDWNSVVNAGMGGQVFQDALKETSRLLGTGVDAAIEANGSFRESLHTGWLTAEVLTETLKKFTTSGANEYVAEYTGLSEEAVEAALESAKAQYGEADAIEYASKALAKKSGKNAKEIADILQFAKTAEDAATKVKTFSQLWDTMKEAAQSGWAQTWRIIIGDFEEAKELLTGISDFFTGDNGIITKMSNARNTLLESALGKGFTGLLDDLKDLLDPIDDAIDAVDDLGDSFNDLGDIVDRVIMGEFGNVEPRWNKLTEMGYNWMEVQNAVNEKLGNSYRYTTDQVKAQDKLIDSQKKTSKATEETTEETTKLTDAQKDLLKELVKKSDEELRSLGYTEKQIAALNALRETAEKLGLPLDTFIDKLDEINGRWLLWNSFANIGKSLTKIFGSIGKAWGDVFDPIQPEQLFNVIAAFHKFTTSLIMSDEAAENLRKTFKGLFAVLDLVTTVVGGGIKISFKALSAILGAFDMDILSVTGAIGEAIYNFRDWVFEQNILAKALKNFVNMLPKAVDQVREWTDAFKEIPAVEAFAKAIENIADAFKKLDSGEISLNDLAEALGSNLAKALKLIPGIMVEIGKDVIAGFQNGIEAGISGSIIGKIISFCKEFIAAFAEALGVQSPSWKTYDIAVDTIQGFINGLKAAFGGIVDFVKYIGTQIVNAFKFVGELITDDNGNIDWGRVFALGTLAGIALTVKKVLDIAGGIAGAFEGLGDILNNTGLVMKSFSKVLNGLSWDLKAKAIQKMAISIAILAAAVAVLSFIEPAKLWNSVGIITALAAILAVLAVAMDKISQASVSIGKGGAKLDGLKTGLLQIGLAILLLGVTVKMLGSMNTSDLTQGFIGLIGVVVALGALIGVIGGVSKLCGSVGVAKLGGTILAISVAMMLMTGVIKIVSGMSAEDLLKGLAVMEVFVLLIIQMGVANMLAGPLASKFGGTVLKISIAMVLMVGVIKLIAGMEPGDIIKGLAVMEVFILFVRQMSVANRLAGPLATKFGGTVLKISAAMVLMVGVIKLIATMNVGDIAKGLVVMELFVLLIAEMLIVAKIGGQSAKLAGTLIAMSLSIAILAGVATLLGMMDLGGLVKGITAVGLLSVMMTAMIKALKGAQNVKGAIMMMAVAIGIMAGSVVALSFIKPDKLAGATAAMAILMGMFALIANTSKNVKTSMGTMGVMIAAVAALAGILYLLSSLKVGSTMEISGSLSLLMMSLAASMQMVGKTGSSAMKAMPAMLAMSGVLAIVAVILGVLAALDVGSTIEIAASLSMLLLSLSTSMLLMSQVGASAMAAMPVAYAMSGVLAIIAVILGVLAALDVGPTLEIAASLSMLLLSLSAACLIMAGAAAIATVAAAGLIPMMALMVGMGALMAVIAGLVTLIPDLESFLSKALPVLKLIGEGIGEFLGGIISGVMSSVMDLLPQFGTALSGFMVGAAPFIAMAGTIDSNVLAGIGYLSAAILALTAANLISGIGQFLSFGQDFSDLGTQLSAFITNAQPFLTGIHAIDPAAIESASTLAKLILTLTAAELLDGIAGLVSRFTGGNSFEDFGTQLTAFGDAMVQFSNTVSGNIDPNAIQVAADAGAKLAKLQSSLEPMGGVVQWFTGEKDFAKFGEQFVAFGKAMVTFSETIAGMKLDATAFDMVITAGTKLAELQSSLEPMGGVVQFFTGEKDFEKFGEQFVAFGKSMVTFSESISGMNMDSAALATVIDTGTKLAELQSSLEPMGGVVQFFTGDRDFATFGEQISSFGKSMKDFAETIGTGIDEAAIQTVINSGTMLTELQKAIPKEGWFDGKINLEEFSGYIDKFSTAMSDFNADASEMDSLSMIGAVNAARNLTRLMNDLVDLDTSGVEKFTGASGAVASVASTMADYSNKVAEIDSVQIANSLTFARSLKDFIVSLADIDSSGIENFKVSSIGTSMGNYANSVKDMDAAVVSSSITSANRLKEFIESLSGFDGSGIENFNLGSLGSTLKSYSNSVVGFEAGTVTSSISSATKIKNFIASLAGLDTSGVSSFTAAINELGTVSIDSIVESFSGASTKMLSAGSDLIASVANGMQSEQSTLTDTVTTLLESAQNAITSKEGTFKTAGSKLMTTFITGLKSESPVLSTTVGAAIVSAASSMRSYYTSFYSAGTYLGSGLVLGINAKKTAAYNAGYALGQAAVRGEKDGQASNSPSKLTIQAGKWLGEGLIIGINKMGTKVYKAGHDLGDNAASSMSSSIAKIADAINTDIDAQPTIRPVLDLDEIKAGANTIDGLLNSGNSIGLNANLSAISTMMNRRNQNGANGDVVSAINRLRKDLGNVGNTTYNVNGITYDDGSNITEAVQTLVRAAIMERRI